MQLEPYLLHKFLTNCIHFVPCVPLIAKLSIICNCLIFHHRPKRKEKARRKRIADNDNTPKEKEKVWAVSSQRIFCFTLVMHGTANLLNLAYIPSRLANQLIKLIALSQKILQLTFSLTTRSPRKKKQWGLWVKSKVERVHRRRGQMGAYYKPSWG